MERRDFLKATAGTVAALVAGRYIDLPLLFSTKARAHELTGTAFEFMPRQVLLENVDRTLVYHWAWQAGHDLPTIAGPTLILEPGVEVSVTVHNPLDEPHGWAVTDRNGGFLVNTGPIPPGGTATVPLTINNPGTYLYLDPVNAPVNRVMGLFGGIIVKPVAEDGKVITPYSGGTLAVPANIQNLFNDFGTKPHFHVRKVPAIPGSAWDPNDWNLWLFGSIDPSKNRLVQRLGFEQVINPEEFVANYTPRYFYINGRQGYFAAHDSHGMHDLDHDTNHSIDLASPPGKPRLIRNINVGLSTHSPHVHANHAFLLFDSDPGGIGNGPGLQTNIAWIDTWTMRPMDHKDAVYPFIKPPDIPEDTWARLLEGRSQEGFPGNPMHHDAAGNFIQGFPMYYPMHCHLELSQTSGGGNYPQGMVTHITFMDPNAHDAHAHG